MSFCERQIYVLDLKWIYWSMVHKADARDPRLLETVEIAPRVWDRKNRDYVISRYAEIHRRVPLVLARLERRRQWQAGQNQSALAGMSAEQAREALTCRGSRALSWFESLPYGITPQAASDATGLSFVVSWWEADARGQVQRSISYSPFTGPRKGYQRAKAI